MSWYELPITHLDHQTKSSRVITIFNAGEAMMPFTDKGSTLILIGPKGQIVEDVGKLMASHLRKPFVGLW